MSSFDDYLNAPAAAPPQSFDAYLGATSAQPASGKSGPPSAQTPAPQGSQPGMLASAAAGLGHGFGETMLGAQQLLGRGLSALGSTNVGPWLTQDAQRGIANLNSQFSPYQSANPISAGAGNVAGQIAGTTPAMLVGPEYAALGLGGRIGLGAAQGAAAGAMLPTTDQDFWKNKGEQMLLGGALGGVTPLAAAGASAAGRGLWNAVKPVLQPGEYVGQGIAGAMEPSEAAQAAASIRGAPTFVPGSLPTTAQVAQTPVMVQTEKAAANMPAMKTALAQRAIDNNDARWNALMGVAGTPADLAAAQAARESAATPLYQAAHASTANVGPAFMRYAQIPEMQEAMQRANQIASLEAAVGRGVAPVWPQQGGSNAINGAALDYTSRALGDMVSEAQRSGATARAGALGTLKGDIDNWTARYIPGVQQARDAYAAGSVPVNTMEAGQQIANTLGTRAMNSGGAPEIQMMPFRSALTSAMNSGNAAKYGIDANALNTLQGIGQDLQRATVSNSIRSPGSDTAYNLAANGWLARQLYGPTFSGAGNVGKAVGALGATALGHPMVGLGILGGGNKIGQMVGSRLQNRLTDLLMNPDAILPYLDARGATPMQAIPGPLMQGLLNYGRPAAVAGLLGGLQNSGNK